MNYTSSIIKVLVCAFMLVSCTPVTMTGRKQLNLISNDKLIPMSFQQYDEIIQKGPLSEDQGKVQLIKKVGKRIQKAVENYMVHNNTSSELKNFSWEFNLIDDPKTVNAWCMPGGKVAFYTGILPICQNERGIAVVMGHEVAHAIANHGRERMSQKMIQLYGLTALGVAGTSDLLFQAVGMGSSLGMLKFSRKHESEADHMGLLFMAMAGYDPNQAPEFWERMADLSQGSEPYEFLSTHPSHKTRIEDLKNWIPEAMKYYRPERNK